MKHILALILALVIFPVGAQDSFNTVIPGTVRADTMATQTFPYDPNAAMDEANFIFNMEMVNAMGDAFKRMYARAKLESVMMQTVSWSQTDRECGGDTSGFWDNVFGSKKCRHEMTAKMYSMCAVTAGINSDMAALGGCREIANQPTQWPAVWKMLIATVGIATVTSDVLAFGAGMATRSFDFGKEGIQSNERIATESVRGANETTREAINKVPDVTVPELTLAPPEVPEVPTALEP